MIRALKPHSYAAIAVALLSFGIVNPVAAQSAGQTRVGGGLSVVKGGVGVTGGVVVPVKEFEPRTLSVVGAASLIREYGTNLVAFGGGLRWTRMRGDVGQFKNFRYFGQGLLGVEHQSFDGFGFTNGGLAVGGGMGFSINPTLDAFVEADLTRVQEGNGLLFTFGVSRALGKK